MRLRSLAAALGLAAFSLTASGMDPHAPHAFAFDWAGKIEAIAAGLEDADPEHRLEAVQELAAADGKRTKRHLLPVLRDPQERVRQAAAKVLGRNQVLEAIAPVSEWLASSSKDERRLAASVLGDIRSPKAIPALTRTLGDPEADVRAVAVEALGRIGGSEGVVAIIGRLDDEAAQVRRAATEQLLALGDRRAVIPLLERFGDTSKDVRITAIKAVGTLGDPQAVPALLRLLGDSLDEVRVAAVEALGNLRAEAAVAPLVALLERRGDEFRAKVAFALGQIASPAAVRALVEALATEGLRPAAREALLQVGGPAVDPLLASLDGELDGDPGTAVSLLASLRDRRATPALLRELERGRVKREPVIEALGALGDPRALVPLLALVESSEPEIRGRAIAALAPIVDARAGDVLVRALGDREVAIRAQAADLVGELQIRAAVPKLLALLEAKNPELPDTARYRILAALGAIGDPRATPALLAALRAPKGDLRRTAADALASLRDPGSVDALLALVKDATSHVRREALAALRGALRDRKGAPSRAYLESLAVSAEPPLALGAIDVLAAMRDPASVEVLRSLAAQGPRDLRRAALEALGNFQDRRVTPLLTAALAEDDDALRATAAWALGKLADGAAQPALSRAAQGRDFAVVVNATAALARLGDARRIPELKGLLEHRVAYVRANAAWGLARLGATDAQKALRAQLDKDPNPYARAAAARALVTLAHGKPDAELRAGLRRLELQDGGDSDFVRIMARELGDAADVGAAKPTTAATEPSRDTWLHIYWTDEEGAPLRQERYAIVDPTGLVKAGYTDVRGETSEDPFPRGVYDYLLLDEKGESVRLTR